LRPAHQLRERDAIAREHPVDELHADPTQADASIAYSAVADAASRAQAFGREARDRESRHAAWRDEVESGHVRGDVEREPVHADAVAHANADRAELAARRPNAAAAVIARRAHAERRGDLQHDRLERR